tara:strand:- start:16 stop:354 length:339 start_codon:yes stop_codon:yes gene_type:complete
MDQLQVQGRQVEVEVLQVMGFVLVLLLQVQVQVQVLQVMGFVLVLLLQVQVQVRQVLQVRQVEVEVGHLRPHLRLVKQQVVVLVFELLPDFFDQEQVRFGLFFHQHQYQVLL